MTPDPTAEIDTRFSDPEAGPTPWPEAANVLDHAELYWLTTVRADGRPHVTPLIGVHEDGAVHFCTGLAEQKARNLKHSSKVAVTTGNNTWARKGATRPDHVPFRESLRTPGSPPASSVPMPSRTG